MARDSQKKIKNKKNKKNNKWLEILQIWLLLLGPSSLLLLWAFTRDTGSIWQGLLMTFAAILVVLIFIYLLPLIISIFGIETYEERKKRIRKKFREKSMNPNKSDQQPNVSENENIKSSGTGFFVNKDGYAVTNYHVIENMKRIRMSIKEKEFEAVLVATDKVNDLAILKTNQVNHNFFKLSKDDAERLDEVTAVGYGFGKSMSDEIKTTRGVVSALSGLGNNYSHLQIDAAIQPGNSGGPVINSNGDVIGVAVAKADAIAVFNYTGTLAEGVSFAIKTSTLKQFLKSNKIEYEVIENEKRVNSEINQLIDTAALYIFN